MVASRHTGRGRNGRALAKASLLGYSLARPIKHGQWVAPGGRTWP